MRLLSYILISLFFLPLSAQESEQCKLEMGMNLGGVFDYGTEIPFVDLMRCSRQWYTRDIDNDNADFDSQQRNNLTFRSDGYPTHVPQSIEESEYDQKVITIWAITDGWPIGEYTVLWEGEGELLFWGGHENLTQTDDHRITFDFLQPKDNALELTIVRSEIDDPIRNIRVLMPGTESTYNDQPFYDLWLEKLEDFGSIRFMDWGSTNAWGQPDAYEWNDPSLFDWEDRAQMDHYTWANEKGIPYEMMIALMNEEDKNGWLCVPHRASDDYIRKMASLFHNALDKDVHLTIEYSNEIWNWIFGQTHWLNEYGCIQKEVSWPEGIVPYVQNCLDIWSDEYEGELDRITRAAGVQLGYFDVSNRMIRGMRPGSFDGISPTFYFGITDEGDEILDALGESATVSDVTYYAREGIEHGKGALNELKDNLSDPLELPLLFYEGGQHITNHPFGEAPTWSDALLATHRDTSMYNMYMEWFDFIETLQYDEKPLLLMNFSFIANLNAQYGSWGVLETMDQDLSVIPAPKYQAIIDRINLCEVTTSTVDLSSDKTSIYPNPSSGVYTLNSDLTIESVTVYDVQGKRITSINSFNGLVDMSSLENGIYFLKVGEGIDMEFLKVVLVK